MIRLYNTALSPLRPLAALWAAWIGGDRELRREWRERRAKRLPQAPPGGIWLHGSSVGEAAIVGALARALRGGPPLVVSAFTATGRRRLPEPPEVDATFFLPLDLPGYPRRLLRRLRPALLALVETELWPNLLREAGEERVPVAVLNGRLAPERMARYRRFAALYRPALRRLVAVGAQSAGDAERFVELGVPAPAVEITGNVKYDLPDPPGDAAALRARLGLAPSRPVFVAGSTRPGEEPMVLAAFAAALRHHPELCLILAPRHPRRFDEAAALAGEAGQQVLRLSELGERKLGTCAVLLVDTLGELAALYRLASVAFVGGSLVPLGGHSPLEPAAVGAPVLFGPHTEHFAEPAEALVGAGGACRVADSAELGRTLSRLLGDPAERARRGAAARAVVEANRGALERTVGLLRAALERGAAAASGDPA